MGDERCAATLRGLPQELSQWVVDQEFIVEADPAKGSASAKVVGMIKKAKSLSLPTPTMDQLATPCFTSDKPAWTPGAPAGTSSPRLDSFVVVNLLDDRCAALLTSLSPQQLDWVMDQEFIIA